LPGAKSISQALKVNQTLLELHMGNNDIGDDGINAIAGSLNKSSITVLDVCACHITFTGVKLLAEALSTNQNIRQIGLWGNTIEVEGARLILQTAVNNGTCYAIGVNYEYEEEDDEVDKMMTILYHRKIQHVKKIELCDVQHQTAIMDTKTSK